MKSNSDLDRGSRISLASLNTNLNKKILPKTLSYYCHKNILLEELAVELRSRGYSLPLKCFSMNGYRFSNKTKVCQIKVLCRIRLPSVYDDLLTSPNNHFTSSLNTK